MGITVYGLQQIKKELQHLPREQLTEMCLRLIRYKKENKELLAYLLFEANNEQGFIDNVKAEAGFMFSQLPSQSYFAAKGLRKILRSLNKYTKFMGSKPAEIELLISFCNNYLQYMVKQAAYKPVRLIFIRQIEKIRALIGKLHEDLQFDYGQNYNELLDKAEHKLPWLNKKSYLL